MCEHLLPPAVLAKASLRGKEYAWPPSAVPEALAAARSCRLAAVGGQPQFRIPDGTCELYWGSLDSGGREPGGTWGEYVARSVAEVTAQFEAAMGRTDFTREAAAWDVLARLQAEGADVTQYLCFVLYFESEPSLSIAVHANQ